MSMVLLTEPEAAERLHISTRLLRDLRRQGHIRYVALSARRIAYREEDCDEYVQSRVKKVEPCPTPKRKLRPKLVSGGGSAKIIPFSEIHQGRQ